MEFKHMTYCLPHMSISFVWQPKDQVIPCHTKSFPTWFCLRVNLHGTRASGLHSSSISQVVSNAISTLSIPDPFIILYWFVTSHGRG